LRENNYNTGLRGVLFDAGHYARMGAAVWLYGWLVLRQTHQTGTIGWVLGGAPIHYREIEEETGFNRRTLERWMKNLRRQKYIETTVVDGGIAIRILKAKKHLHLSASSKAVRGDAEGVRKVAGGPPQKCVASRIEKHSRQQVTSGIGSSLVVRIKEKEEQEFRRPVENEEQFSTEMLAVNARNEAVRSEVTASEEEESIHKNSWSGQNQQQNRPHISCRESCHHEALTSFHNIAAPRAESSSRTQRHQSSPSETSTRENQRPATQQNFSWDLRERMRLIRAERDEAVRRELAVGSGPEVRRQ
jgi:hypothetical protein